MDDPQRNDAIHVQAAPGRASLGPLVEAFDARSDLLLERIRGNAIADRVFTTASHVGDFSLVWHSIGLARAIIRRRPDQFIVLAAAIGAESLIVNQGVKRIFRRARPTVAGDERLQVRQPSTSSFPSGHASAAAFAATLLTAWDGRRWGRLWWTIASVVGASRAYVRIHHASDVVGGAVVGRALALLVRPSLRRLR
ncbi:MAG: phosphatase PAP2 family protein [Ilumatobacter sp.]|uniref:phosphatase PAP2 family protein n=1 Tax=Ilumatobacter sp. TaxID=1967498 RepID=UPI0039199AF6